MIDIFQGWGLEKLHKINVSTAHKEVMHTGWMSSRYNLPVACCS